MQASQFGEIAFIQWTIDTAFVAVSLGLTAIGSRFYAQLRASSAHLRFDEWYLRKTLPVVGATSAVALCSAYVLTDLRAPKILFLVATWAAGSAAWALGSARLQGLQRFSQAAAVSIGYVAVALAGIAIAPADISPMAAGIVFTCAAMAAAALTLYRLPTRMQCAEAWDERAVTRYGLNMWISVFLGSLVWSRAELLVLRTMVGSSDVGRYVTALTIAGVANTALALMTSALAPQLAALWGRGDRDAVRRLSEYVSDLLMCACLAVVTILILFGDEILTLAFGTRYGSSYPALVVLALGSFGLTSACVNVIAQYESDGRFTRNLNVLAAGSLLLFAGLLVRPLGINGAALSRSGVQIAMAAATYVYVARRGYIRVNWRNIAICVVVAGVTSALAYGVGHTQLYVKVSVLGVALSVLVTFFRVGADRASISQVVLAHLTLRMRKL
jgi:O-antigen/teichoic acid export membrane protein